MLRILLAAAVLAIAGIVPASASGVVIGHRPAGCPAGAWCGCGLARYLQIPDPKGELNLAWHWAEVFPRTIEHPGAAAVRHGHVMLLHQHVEGHRWEVIDFNGGRGLAWRHVRNVRGYVFVEPGQSFASAVERHRHRWHRSGRRHYRLARR